MAAAIANEINVQLTPQEQAHFASARPVNPAAYDAYLKGRYFLNDPSDAKYQKSARRFEHAIQLDPELRTGLCRSGVCLHLGAGVNERSLFLQSNAAPKAKAAAEKALQLDNTLAEAH